MEEREEIKSTRLKAGNFDCILTTFETVMKEKSSLNKLVYEYLILDEAQRIKNEESVLS